MSEYMQKIQTAADTIRQAVGGADVGIILGSGLGDYVEALEEAGPSAMRIFPVSRAPRCRDIKAAG